MDNIAKKIKLRKKRSLRVRKRVRGNSQKPRLCVVKSNLHIEAQLIDDENGITIASASTKNKELAGLKLSRRSKDSASYIGKVIAEKAKSKGCTQLVFDRGFSKYHGILISLATAARENGIKF